MWCFLKLRENPCRLTTELRIYGNKKGKQKNGLERAKKQKQ